MFTMLKNLTKAQDIGLHMRLTDACYFLDFRELKSFKKKRAQEKGRLGRGDRGALERGYLIMYPWQLQQEPLLTCQTLTWTLRRLR